MHKNTLGFSLFLLGAALAGCNEGDPANATPSPQIVLTLKVDPNQERLDNFGNAASMPAGHAAQTPKFHKIAIHYVELLENQYTQLGSGIVLYDSPMTSAGGAEAIDFNKTIIASPPATAALGDASQIPAGTYNYMRVSINYQEYDVAFEHSLVGMVTGRLASFVGENSYITSFDLNGESIQVNGNKAQGYWAFKPASYPAVQGQAPAGSTTVVNPIAADSPIPPGSCVATGKFSVPLVITGGKQVNLEASLSNNQSFEWTDGDGDGKWDPELNETVVDMGIRGLVPSGSEESVHSP